MACLDQIVKAQSATGESKLSIIRSYWGCWGESWKWHWKPKSKTKIFELEFQTRLLLVWNWNVLLGWGLVCIKVKHELYNSVIARPRMNCQILKMFVKSTRLNWIRAEYFFTHCTFSILIIIHLFVKDYHESDSHLGYLCCHVSGTQSWGCKHQLKWCWERRMPLLPSCRRIQHVQEDWMDLWKLSW